MSGAFNLSYMRTAEARLMNLLLRRPGMASRKMRLMCKPSAGEWLAVFEVGPRSWSAQAVERRAAVDELEKLVRRDITAPGFTL